MSIGLYKSGTFNAIALIFASIEAYGQDFTKSGHSNRVVLAGSQGDLESRNLQALIG